MTSGASGTYRAQDSHSFDIGFVLQFRGLGSEFVFLPWVVPGGSAEGYHVTAKLASDLQGGLAGFCCARVSHSSLYEALNTPVILVFGFIVVHSGYLSIPSGSVQGKPLQGRSLQGKSFPGRSPQGTAPRT